MHIHNRSNDDLQEETRDILTACLRRVLRGSAVTLLVAEGGTSMRRAACTVPIGRAGSPFFAAEMTDDGLVMDGGSPAEVPQEIQTLTQDHRTASSEHTEEA